MRAVARQGIAFFLIIRSDRENPTENPFALAP